MKTRNWWISGFAWLLAVLLRTFSWKKKVVTINLMNLDLWKHISREVFYKDLIRHLTIEFFYWLGNYTNVQYTDSTIEIFPKLQQGGILLTAHMGNWELFGSALSMQNIPLRASYQPLKSKLANQLLLKLRSRKTNYVVDLTSNPFQLKSLIESKSLITFMLDQDYRSSDHYMEGRFFGKPVACNPLPFRLQKKFSLPVFVGWSYRDKDGTLWIDIQMISDSFLNRYHSILENSILEQPSQWAGWTHRRFKRLFEIY